MSVDRKLYEQLHEAAGMRDKGASTSQATHAVAGASQENGASAPSLHHSAPNPEATPEVTTAKREAQDESAKPPDPPAGSQDRRAAACWLLNALGCLSNALGTNRYALHEPL